MPIKLNSNYSSDESFSSAIIFGCKGLFSKASGHDIPFISLMVEKGRNIDNSLASNNPVIKRLLPIPDDIPNKSQH